MTPEQITAITAIAALLKSVGTWPILSIFLLMAAFPLIAIIFVTYTQDKRIRNDEKKFQEMKTMYENNIILVKGYEKTANNMEKVIQSVLECFSLGTAKWTEAIQKIDTNQFCPAHRTRKHMEAVES